MTANIATKNNQLITHDQLPATSITKNTQRDRYKNIHPSQPGKSNVNPRGKIPPAPPAPKPKLASIVTVDKISEIRQEVFNAQINECSNKHYLGLNRENMMALFGPSLDMRNQFLSFGNELFMPILMQDIDTKTCLLTTADVKVVKEGVFTGVTTICKLSAQNLKLKTVNLIISPSKENEAKIESKDNVKKAIAQEFSAIPIKKGEFYDFKYNNVPYRLFIENIFQEDGSTCNYGVIYSTTRIKLRKRESEKIIIADNIKRIPGAKFSFRITNPGPGNIEVLRSKLVEMIDKHYLIGSDMVPHEFTTRFEYNSKNVDIRLCTISTGSKKYGEEARHRTKRFIRPSDAEIHLDNDSDVKIVNTIDPPKIVEKPTPAPTSKVETKYALNTKGLSFPRFLEEQGMRGVPDEIINSIIPILGIYGQDTEMRNFLFERGVIAEKGILFYGPPGNGKTTFAEKIMGYLNCPEERVKRVACSKLLGGVVGETEKNIDAVFAQAKQEALSKGKDSPLFIIFFDEFDAVAVDRNDPKLQSYQTAQVGALLTNLDGIEKFNNILVLAATNFQNKIDPAVLRPGRFGRQIFIDNPNPSLRKNLLELFLKDKQEYLSRDIDMDLLTKMTEGFSAADIKGLINTANNDASAKLQILRTEQKLSIEVLKKHPEGQITMKNLMLLIKTMRDTKGLTLQDALKFLMEAKFLELAAAAEEEKSVF